MNRLFILALMLLTGNLAAQDVPEFIMSDTTVTACDGRLYDSGYDAQYNIGENLTFTISSTAPVNVVFEEQFCVEIGFDQLAIYDGPDVFSPLIGVYDGFDLPPPFTSSGSVTFHFTSNENVQYCGFQLLWDVDAPPPNPPVADLLPPACESNVVPFSFSYPVGCDWLQSETVNFYSDNTTFNVVDINLNCEGDSSSLHELVLNQPISVNCNYYLEMQLLIPDACDSLWTFPYLQLLEYDDCPIRLETYAASDEICAGQCTDIWAEVEGCYEHTFEWDSGESGAGPHTVCPTASTAYVVTVTEVPTGNTATDTVTVVVTDAQILNAPDQYCQSAGILDLEASPVGGTWSGDGIQEVNQGWFDPDSAVVGLNTVVYEVGSGCQTSAVIEVVPIATDSVVAACPGSGAFVLNAAPTGGAWDGGGVLADGTFDPITSGTFESTYTVSGCISNTLINVANLSTNLEQPVWCQSLWADSLGVTPFGGTWSGPGIVDPLAGMFDPNESGPGIHSLTYAIEGCSDTYEVEVLGIDAGGFNTSACPEEPAYEPADGFTPTGGIWTGWGITDAVSGTFDPASVPNDTWTNLVYTAPNGCTDTVFMYVRQTEILIDPMYQCTDWNDLPLTWDEIGRTPGGGTWAGTGAVNPEGNYWVFSNDIAGVGVHTLVYTANTCSDTTHIIVHPAELNHPPIAVCEAAAPIELLPELPPGSTFDGIGVTDPNGVFDPLLAGPGEFTVTWSSPAGCTDTFTVAVEDDLPASITGLAPVYCWQDAALPVDIQPEVGTITGPVNDGTFNPAEAGAGTHLITVDYLGILCSSSATFEVEVLPALEAEIVVSDTLICPGEGVELEALYGGGGPDAVVDFFWNQDLIALPTHTTAPDGTTTYILTVTDECSDPAVDEVTVEVLPPIAAQVSTSDTLCIGLDGWLTAAVSTPGTYDLYWGSDALQIDTLFAPAGTAAQLLVEDTGQGCQWDTLLVVPNYTPVSAQFSPNPNEDCIPFEANPVQFLDLSQYGLSGTWDFGNGEIADYIPATTPEVIYDTPGTYSVSLFLVNEGDCLDSAFVDLCILPPTELFVPDAFSPNGDLMNDVLYVRGKGITELELVIYNHWGEAVYESRDPEQGWDGTHRGEPAASGNYAYRLVALVNDWKRVEQTGNILLVR